LITLEPVWTPCILQYRRDPGRRRLERADDEVARERRGRVAISWLRERLGWD